jgi:osmoprotectant transport system permease protein
VLLAPIGSARAERPVIAVGSKKFTESVILGELVRIAADGAGADVTHRRELGGTRVLYSALLAGEIDAYAEYTGTLRQELLRSGAQLSLDAVARALAEQGLRMTAPLGFENTYALGMLEPVAARLGITMISDLRAHPELALGFTNEFMDRADGWPSLRRAYALPQRDVRGLDHDLAYRGLAEGALAVTDLYSTDADIAYYGLRVLADDRGHFPEYQAVVLYRADLASRAPAIVTAIEALAGRIDAPAMIAMNAAVKLSREREAAVAARFAREALGIDAVARAADPVSEMLGHARAHLALVAVSLAMAIGIALPLGIWCAEQPRVAQLVLGAMGIVQTIPSLALLVFMIPLFGIGAPPAIAALFLYSLLPIVRNTYTGLRDVPDAVRESAEALGLPRLARLRLVELPLAARSILAGIKTSAVINVGTATLGALIGAGGFGQPILTGVRLDDLGLILSGAIPAAILALATQGVFDLAERAIVPRGLRLERGA